MGFSARTSRSRRKLSDPGDLDWHSFLCLGWFLGDSSAFRKWKRTKGVDTYSRGLIGALPDWQATSRHPGKFTVFGPRLAPPWVAQGLSASRSICAPGPSQKGSLEGSDGFRNR
uniref:Uncharacterized protein n=1 Tax=Chromera velia CCMP2878 TaxID=1169474 RepID=A0A0G4FD24_9ALVE|mmetsp:Transcript_43353/g.85553  ORF Transcript_43353/g.85553 Transcript_43353/m.85553 type:complete len:114 (-) Transcript_43353:72-413(-)|eukprot:Cvel_16295.t1-p1 / transcript=Cvel_16295.t1 / gene=Cvel_16295 / organism=Chromera_velia_CCMP2878 / gene_product=hypothetical protein / transcript_product=hypothetical protein / location=Cvel_scaffold1249:44472-45434(-) / protein_length=113 / sequence_SO=supercontig / SO=protein_coding / is_pseudo=false